MKKQLLLFVLCSLFLVSCEKNDLDLIVTNSTLAPNEFALLFPGETVFGLNHVEVNNGETVFLHTNSFDNVTLTLIDDSGRIIWTKEHHNILGYIASHISAFPFLHNNKIIVFTTGSGLHRYEFDLNGELLNSKTIIANDGGYRLSKEGGVVHGVKTIVINPGTDTRIIKVSLEGDLIETINVSTSSNISSENWVKIKNDRIYMFGRSLNQGPDLSDDIYFCEVFDRLGNLITRIETPTPANQLPHTQLVLNNGNILIAVANYTSDISNNPNSYDLRLFDPQGALIRNLTFESPGDNLQLRELPNYKIAIAGKEKSSSSGMKQSQFVVLNSSLDEMYRRNIGSFDGNETFYILKEYLNSYHMYGFTSGTDGDFDLPNNSSTRDLFYLKLDK
tara:strand:+ start:10595 stop:11767 length:1173 start_codon:yes stop_codon:yes gene_type:complete